MPIVQQANKPKSETEAMQELASLLWTRYFRERVRGELNHEMNGYKAEVVAINGDGTLTVQRPFENTALTLKCPAALENSISVGEQVLVIGIGDKSTALSNAFVLCKTDLSNFGDASTDTLAYPEPGTTASRNYAAGVYFYSGGELYRTTTTIARGTSFDTGAGGNCELVTGGGLNSIGQSDTIFSTATDVSTDTTITTSAAVTGYTTLALLFNTSSSNPSNTRGFVNLPEFELQNSAYHPLCIDGTVGWVRISRQSGQINKIQIASTSFNSLYLIAVTGIR